jgi:vancomycin resistance protein YoaR
VCQVSSTLYNAAAAARLKIVEIHHHSRPVGYVAPGKDATVSYDDLDLKLSNNRAGPVIIMAGVSQGKVWVQISGRSEASENTLLP